MKKKHHALIEHYLIPTVLFVLNICLVHVIHAFMEDSAKPALYKAALVVSFALLGSSLVTKRRGHLMGAILFYGLVVLLI